MGDQSADSHPRRNASAGRHNVSIRGQLGGTRRDRGRITVLERPARFEFETEGSAGIDRNWFTISGSDAGCVLTKGSHNTRLSLFSCLMIPVLAVIVPRMYDRNLQAIKTKIESARAH